MCGHGTPYPYEQSCRDTIYGVRAGHGTPCPYMQSCRDTIYGVRFCITHSWSETPPLYAMERGLGGEETGTPCPYEPSWDAIMIFNKLIRSIDAAKTDPLRRCRATSPEFGGGWVGVAFEVKNEPCLIVKPHYGVHNLTYPLSQIPPRPLWERGLGGEGYQP